MKYILTLNHLIKIICFLILFTLLHSCKSVISDKIEHAKSYIKDNSDSTLIILNEIIGSYDTAMTEREKAFFGLYYIIASDKNHIQIHNDEIINYSIDYFNKWRNTTALSYCYLYKSRLYSNKSNFNEAITLLLHAQEYADENKEPSLYAKIIYDLGVVSSNQQKTQKALDYYEKSLRYFKIAEEYDNMAKTYTVMGELYRDVEKYDTSFVYLAKRLNCQKILL